MKIATKKEIIIIIFYFHYFNNIQNMQYAYATHTVYNTQV